MIDEIVAKVSEKTGLAEEQARQSAEAVIDVLKDRLPEPIAGQIDSFVSGEGGGITDSISGFASGILGGNDE